MNFMKNPFNNLVGSVAGNDTSFSKFMAGDFKGALTELTDYIGLTNYEEQAEAYSNAEQTLQNQSENADKTFDSLVKLAGGEEALANAFNYSYGKTASDFLDPNAEYVINKSVEAAQNKLAGQGGMSGGAAARQLQAEASAAAADLWEKAVDDMEKDRDYEWDKVSDSKDTIMNLILTKMETDSNFAQAMAQLGIDKASNGTNLFNLVMGASNIYGNLK